MGTLLIAGVVRAADVQGPAAPPSRTVPSQVPPALQPSACWIDIRLFYTLRLGPVAICRRHLRYHPGTLECYQFTDQVCQTVDPRDGVVTSRSPIDVAVLPCPNGPEPPVCPALNFPRLP